MNQIDLAFTSALEQAQLIRNKEISPIELTQLYLERIQRLDSQLGSYFFVMAEEAIADAKNKTELLTKTSELPPFFGVPISIKDLNPVIGVPCSRGNQLLKNNIATYDDGVVVRIRQAGCIILGKTSTPELGSFPYTEANAFPPTRNPWNLDYTPGGSSGGAAASLAAGLCAIAQGSDAGGSIRGPAFCCGLVGIKPSRGRVTNAPVGDYLSGMATNGPIARTVADAAALLDIMSGYVTGDPYWLPDPNPSFLAASQTQKLGNLRIAFTTELFPLGEAVSSCKQAVLDTVKLLQNMGHTVENATPDFSGLIEPFTIIWQSAVASSGLPPEALEPMNRWLWENKTGAGEYLRAVQQVQVIARKIVAFFDNFDMLLLPTYLHPQIRVGEWANLNPAETLPRIINWIAPCPPFNVSGQPAIALPTGLGDNNLPVGIQIVGKPAADADVIALAAQIELANSWRDRPPAFAL